MVEYGTNRNVDPTFILNFFRPSTPWPILYRLATIHNAADERQTDRQADRAIAYRRPKNEEESHNLQGRSGVAGFYAAIFLLAGIVTVALISSPSPFYHRRTKGGQQLASHLLQLLV